MRISDWSSTCALPILVRYEYDGSVTVLADKDAQGNGFNAPNDAVVHPDDGSIWFTDPGYGQLMNYEGFRAGTGSVQPFMKEAVYRIDGKTGAVTKVTDEPVKPNGLCFSHRSEEHTSELQSLKRTSYAVLCLK